MEELRNDDNDDDDNNNNKEFISEILKLWKILQNIGKNYTKYLIRIFVSTTQRKAKHWC